MCNSNCMTAVLENRSLTLTKESGIQDAVVAVSSATECRSVGSPRAAAPGGAFTGHAAGGRLTGAPRRASSPHPKLKPRASRAAGLRLPWTACPGQVWPPTLASCYESDKPSLSRYRRGHRAPMTRVRQTAADLPAEPASVN